MDYLLKMRTFVHFVFDMTRDIIAYRIGRVERAVRYLFGKE